MELAPLEYLEFDKVTTIDPQKVAYWHATPLNFPCLDAVLTGSTCGAICGFQYTLATLHGLKHAAFKKILKGMNVIVDKKNQKKNQSNQTFCVYFIVRPHEFENFPLQDYVESNSTKKIDSSKADLTNVVKQYAIKVYLDTEKDPSVQ